MIHVVALITTKPGQRAAVLAAFHANVAAVRAEAGCIEYSPVIDADGAGGMQAKLGEDTFAVIEKWETMDALKAHGRSPHMAEYGAKVAGMVADRAVHVLSDA